MKTNALIRIILFSVLAVLLLGVLIVMLVVPKDGNEITVTTGPASVQQDATGEAGSTGTAGNWNQASVAVEQIREITVDWVAGSITVKPGDVEQILVQETNVPDRPMVVTRKDDELIVKYAEYEFGDIGAKAYKKDLIITVPAAWIGQELEINAAASNVNLEDMKVEEVEINCVSGKSNLVNCEAREFSLNTVSGNVRFSGRLEELECNAVSANCTIALNNTPRKIRMSTVSGKLDLTLPEDSGFRVKLSNPRGKLNTDFPVTLDDDVYVSGDGSCSIHVDGVASSLNIHRQQKQ